MSGDLSQSSSGFAAALPGDDAGIGVADVTGFIALPVEINLATLPDRLAGLDRPVALGGTIVGFSDAGLVVRTQAGDLLLQGFGNFPTQGAVTVQLTPGPPLQTTLLIAADTPAAIAAPAATPPAVIGNAASGASVILSNPAATALLPLLTPGLDVIATVIAGPADSDRSRLTAVLAQGPFAESMAVVSSPTGTPDARLPSAAPQGGGPAIVTPAAPGPSPLPVSVAAIARSGSTITSPLTATPAPAAAPVSATVSANPIPSSPAATTPSSTVLAAAASDAPKIPIGAAAISVPAMTTPPAAVSALDSALGQVPDSSGANPTAAAVALPGTPATASPGLANGVTRASTAAPTIAAGVPSSQGGSADADNNSFSGGGLVGALSDDTGGTEVGTGTSATVPTGASDALPAVGTSLHLRVIALASPVVGAAGPTVPAGPAPSVTDATVPSVPSSLSGTIAAVTARGVTVIETAQGTLALEARTTLPIGGRVTLAITGTTTPPAGAVPAGPIDLSATASDWPALRQAFDALANINTMIAQEVAVSTLPQVNTRLAATMFGFINQVRRGTARDWLGEPALEILERSGHQALAKRLHHDVADMTRQVEQTPPGGWKAFAVPFHDGQELQRVQVLVRRPEKQPDTDEDSKTASDGSRTSRFVVTLALSRLGNLQLDGLLHAKRLDLILRSDSALAEAARHDLQQRFTNALAGLGLAGILTFQAHRQGWVSVDSPPPGPRGPGSVRVSA